MEIIELRSSETNKSLLKEKLTALMQDVKKNNGSIGIKVFFRFEIDTDYRIYLKHNSSASKEEGSQLGQSLVSALKEYGLVHYSKWIELEQKTHKH